MLYPLIFWPIFKERVWGGRNLERFYRKALPKNTLIGESWEITDRPGATSVIANGPLAGKDLRWLMETQTRELLGQAKALNGRFPLLVKILDAQATLSLQVHPPASVASQLGGEPKTELWYFTKAASEAEIFLGFRRGITREIFARKLQEGAVAECFHRHRPRAGNAALIPAGRVHALGAGLILFEIQQNSDTTYRVFDWNRVGLDGRRRELHLAQALASINFDDYEPGLLIPQNRPGPGVQTQCLIEGPPFSVDLVRLEQSQYSPVNLPVATILGLVNGQLAIIHADQTITLNPGQFCLLPASLGRMTVQAATQALFLLTRPDT
jgi:mannose-6-phosphate isomerase